MNMNYSIPKCKTTQNYLYRIGEKLTHKKQWNPIPGLFNNFKFVLSVPVTYSIYGTSLLVQDNEIGTQMGIPDHNKISPMPMACST